jgi:hypothetical protein
METQANHHGVHVYAADYTIAELVTMFGNAGEIARAVWKKPLYSHSQNPHKERKKWLPASVFYTINNTASNGVIGNLGSNMPYWRFNDSIDSRICTSFEIPDLSKEESNWEIQTYYTMESANNGYVYWRIYAHQYQEGDTIGTIFPSKNYTIDILDSKYKIGKDYKRPMDNFSNDDGFIQLEFIRDADKESDNAEGDFLFLGCYIIWEENILDTDEEMN